MITGHRQRKAFTLVEMLISIVILTLLLMVLVSMTDATQRTWTYTSGKVEEFRDAREAFESMSRKLSQATLNTYLDYHYPNGDITQMPDRYIRQSELRFISGVAASSMLIGTTNTPTHAVFFQAPLGYVTDTSDFRSLDNLLNTWGYFIEFASDKSSRPAFINNLERPPAEHYRFRLMELMEPSEQLSLYTYTSGTDSSGKPAASSYTGNSWFTTPLNFANRPTRVLAENIIALIILPKLSPTEQKTKGYTDASLAPRYLYDSTGANMATVNDANLNPINQLPPVIQITLVAVDEASCARLQGKMGKAMPDFSSDLFSEASRYESDLDTLKSRLQESKINYCVLTTNVSLKAAKWSSYQTGK